MSDFEEGIDIVEIYLPETEDLDRFGVQGGEINLGPV